MMMEEAAASDWLLLVAGVESCNGTACEGSKLASYAKRQAGSHGWLLILLSCCACS
jgi:hypothetical protein